MGEKLTKKEEKLDVKDIIAMTSWHNALNSFVKALGFVLHNKNAEIKNDENRIKIIEELERKIKAKKVFEESSPINHQFPSKEDMLKKIKVAANTVVTRNNAMGENTKITEKNIAAKEFNVGKPVKQ